MERDAADTDLLAFDDVEDQLAVLRQRLLIHVYPYVRVVLVTVEPLDRLFRERDAE